MSNLIGNKSNFAIEYNILRYKPYLMGNFAIWLGNTYIGYFEEEVMLSSIQHSLQQLHNRLSELDNNSFEGKDITEIHNLIYSGRIDNGKYLLSLGESFDDFSLFVFKRKDSVNFVWKLHKDTFFDYPDYDTNINHKAVKIADFVSVVNSFLNIEN